MGCTRKRSVEERNVVAMKVQTTGRVEGAERVVPRIACVVAAGSRERCALTQ